MRARSASGRTATRRAARRTGLTLWFAAALAWGAFHAGAAQAQGPAQAQRPAPVQGRAQGAAGPPPPAPQNARAEAPFDPTGYWVSLVTEAWRFRMVVPGKADYDEIPLSLAGKMLADTFDASAEEARGHACKAYGAPVIMWLPGRLHISWADDNTLRVDTDAGTQRRLLRFKPTAADAAQPPSLQGLTTAHWIIHGAGAFGVPGRIVAGGPPPPRYGYIKATTGHLLPGYLRKNGVPYGGKTTDMTEYWEQHTAPDGAQWLIITTKLTDPVYLADPYVFSPTFRKEPDGSKWHPTPCSLRW
ncbi:MAG TPA: hypothetical protein VHX52_02435 [Steroidobacteraceae bacterium]|jgi:hypothetical protein|nr:hypothetical protein [Steroidobacteraceae bacterium]